MEITGTLVIAADTVLLPVDQLSEELRRQVQASEGDYAVTRTNSRTLARVIGGDAAKLLEEFRQPTSVVQAVIRYCGATRENPEATLDAAFPMLERLVHARLLVPADSPETQRIRPLLEIGSHFAGTEVLACLQTLDDTDLYNVKTARGELAALKLMRPMANPDTVLMFDRETFILKHMDATVSPALLGAGAENELRYLLLSWCPGSDCASGAARLRSSSDHAALLRLSVAILEAYAHLHAQNVIHSDVHPRNILVDGDCLVKIVDFGIARITGVENEFRHSQRGGIGFFFEPEYAKSVREGHPPPYSSLAGEQYAIAALLYFLITGKHYLQFSLEKQEMLRQIAEDEPLRFELQGIQPWPAVQEVLSKALAKDPSERFTSVAALAKAFVSVGQSTAPANAPNQGPDSHAGALEMLTRLLERLDEDAPLFRSGLTTAPRTSVTYGSAGVACGLHRIACALQDPKILSLADLWGERAARESSLDVGWYCSDIEITPELVGRVSPYHTESGVYFIKALIAHSMGDVTTQQNAVDSFITAVSHTPCDCLDLTLGLSGILLTASQLLATLHPGFTINIGALRDLGNTTLARIWRQLDSYPPIAECHQIRYSGIAHGWAGMLYATLCWCRASRTDLPPNVGERLSQLASLAHHSERQARWSWSIVKEASDVPGAYMGGWCNGSAGQVYLWLTAYSVLREHQYLMLAEKAAWHAAETDSGNGSLCCGFSGQAYALLALHRYSRDRAWLQRAHVLAERAAIAYRNLPPGRNFDAIGLRPDSLYKGELGVAVLAADLECPDGAAFPAFEFIEF
jgi:serine/threonine protein kinase